MDIKGKGLDGTA